MNLWNPRDFEKSPFFASVAPLLARLPADRFPDLDDLNALTGPGVISGGGARIRFVPPPAPGACLESSYEMRVHREGAVATRGQNLHDLFNALAWMRFTLSKAALNRSHCAQMLTRDGAHGSRGAVRDAATLFDESGVLVASSSPELLELVRGFQWQTLFIGRRAAVIASMRVFVFGHAILEKAASPYAGLTGRALLLPVDAGFMAAAPDAQVAELDRRTAEHIDACAASAASGGFSPLSLLGLPGWCADNENPAYYGDTAQFRPGRRRAGTA